MARARQLLFRIFYSTSYTFVFFILLAFICASPADTIYQSYRRRRLIDIAFIAGAYVVTGLFALLIYASRIYTNRSVINAIPKTYMPVDENELPNKRIWRFVSSTLIRSAVIAFQAKPRSQRIELEIPEARGRIAAVLALEKSKASESTSFEPQWGIIEHRGWSSPAKDDLPNLEYAVVVAELLDLIEAKAVSLTPSSTQDDLSVTNDRVMELLSRPDNAGMRQYLTLLMDFDVISDTSLVVDFLSHYEQARFAPNPLTEDQFQTLMRLFAELLRNMKPADLSSVNMDDVQQEDKTSNFKPDLTTQADSNFHRRPSQRSSLSDTGSVRRSNIPVPRSSEETPPSQSTHASRQGTQNSSSPAGSLALRSHFGNARSESRTTRAPSSQRPQLHHQASQVSALSSRSGLSSKSSKSGRSVLSTSGSVIVRLNNRDGNDPGSESLPYTIEFTSNNSGAAGNM